MCQHANVGDNIIPYVEMCRREGSSLQRGMNFGLGPNYSVILMSLRQNAPYRDALEDDGSVLIYEGHDAPRLAANDNPKLRDQPERTPKGLLTQNGKFHAASQEFQTGRRSPERVRVYEKIHSGIWSDNGMFHLVQSWKEFDGSRNVFRFRLEAVDDPSESVEYQRIAKERRRLIPTAVKLAVWKRDQGACVLCGATDELHFDHDLPWSKGGTSLRESNVQLLCARHNLQKSDRIL
jgi:5-methylcytosine-specific restriction endonuclease McrA